MKSKIHLALLLVFTFIIGATTMAYATNGFQSHGRFEYKSNPSSATPDVIIDSADLDTIYTEVSTGRGQIATALNNTGYGKLSGSSYTANDSFTSLKEAVENQFDIPANGGRTETFYKTAEGELTTDKTLAADYDSGEDTATELALTNATSANLSAGTMAWDSNGNLIIGTGGDNKSYIEQVKSDPQSYGIETGMHRILLGTYTISQESRSFGWSTNISTATIPNWSSLTSENFSVDFRGSCLGCYDDDYSRWDRIALSTSCVYYPSTGTLTVGVSLSNYVCEQALIQGTMNVYAYY